MRMRTFAVAAVLAASAAFPGPARADFTNTQFNAFLDLINGREGRDAAQDKAVAQANALAGKTYTAFSRELAAYSKIVKTTAKAFASDNGVNAQIANLCNSEAVDGIFVDLTLGSDGTGAAVVQLSNKLGVVKGALLANKKIMKHLVKGSDQSDCSKKLKFFSKAAKGAEAVFKKFGPLEN